MSYIDFDFLSISLSLLASFNQNSEVHLVLCLLLICGCFRYLSSSCLALAALVSRLIQRSSSVLTDDGESVVFHLEADQMHEGVSGAK